MANDELQTAIKPDSKAKKDGFLLSSSRQLTITALMAALLVAGKLVLSDLANIEVVTTLIVIFAFSFGWPALYASFIFCTLDIILYPPSIDVIVSYYMYWNLLALIAVLMKKRGIVSEAAYLALGLVMTACFGFLTSLMTWIFIPEFNSYWALYLSGLVFYAIHITSTLVFMIVAFKPLTRALEKISKKYSV